MEVLEAVRPRTRWRRVLAWSVLAAPLLAIPAAWAVHGTWEDNATDRVAELRDGGVVAAERIERARVSIAAYAGPLLESTDPEVREELQRIMAEASPEGRAELVESIDGLTSIVIAPWQLDAQRQRETALEELRELARDLRIDV